MSAVTGDSIGDPALRAARLPLLVLPARVHRVYRGGKLIDAFRGVVPAWDGYFPEDWIASDTRALNPGREHLEEGLSTVALPGGGEARLADLIAAQPEAMLGERYVARWGARSGVLVKLLDAAERLPVHYHPGREFIAQHRGGVFGKTECWVIKATRELRSGEPSIWLGLRKGVTRQQFEAWVEQQNGDALLGALNRVPVCPGDVYLIPAGLPHAIGPGVMMIEVQEPSDWAFHAEHEAFGITAEAAHQGFGWELALECLDATTYSPADVEQQLKQATPVVRRVGRSYERRLVTPEVAEFFGASEVVVWGSLPMMGGRFAIGLVNEGIGRVGKADSELLVSRGSTFVVPAGAGDWRLIALGRDALRVTLCYPPEA